MTPSSSFPFLHTHTHTRLTALFSGLPGLAGTRKVKPIWILLEQETVRGSGISWAICKSASRSRQITMPLPHHSFLQAGCPSYRPTNSVKASECCKSNFLLDDCKSSDVQLHLEWTRLRLNFCSLVSVNNLPISTTPHLTPLTLLDTSALYLMNTSLFLARTHLSPNLVITIFASFAVSVHTSIPKQCPLLPFCSLQAWPLQLFLSQPAQVSDHPAPTDPELSCTCCCQSSQIQPHHSHPSVSALVKDNWAHWI